MNSRPIQIKQRIQITLLMLLASFIGLACSGKLAHAQWLGYADIVLDYYDSGNGDMAGPYGRNNDSAAAPVPVSLDVVLGPEETLIADVLSLPTDSYVTVGFTDETVIDGPGNDIFIREIGAAGDRANVYVSSNNVDFVFLGEAQDNVTTSFDLSSIGFSDPVTAVKIVGLNAVGDSQGFDVAYVEVLPGSIGAPEETLRTPVYTKFNTFLRQSNFLELTSAGSEGFDVSVTIYNLAGQVMTTTDVTLAANSQFDVDINTLIVSACSTNPTSCSGFEDLDSNGVIDTYGVVRLDFFEEEVDSNKILLGRISNYRSSSDGDSYDFAFAKELRNPSRGNSYATANTYHPLGLGVVPNWTEIINLDSENSKSFTYNIYAMNGSLVYSADLDLEPLGEQDIQAGHEILDSEGNTVAGVYLIEVIPEDTSADYLMSVSRYSLNPDGTYNYAFAVDGSNGSNDALFAPITNEDRSIADCALTTNWLEVVNVLNTPVAATVTFRDDTGTTKGQETIEIGAKSQFHFNASALLQSSSTGLAEISSTIVGALISQSLVYYQDCDANGLQTAYATPAKSKNREVQATGTINTFINMESRFRGYSTVPIPTNTVISVKSFASETAAVGIALNGYAGTDMQISDNSSFNFPANTYGTAMITTAEPGDMFAQTLRIRRKFEGGRTRLDFIIPGLLR